MSDFKVGDVVTLKSGGPKMTISERTETQAHCSWFANDEPKTSWFDLLVLEPADPPPTDHETPKWARQFDPT